MERNVDTKIGVEGVLQSLARFIKILNQFRHQKDLIKELKGVDTQLRSKKVPVATKEKILKKLRNSLFGMSSITDQRFQPKVKSVFDERSGEKEVGNYAEDLADELTKIGFGK